MDQYSTLQCLIKYSMVNYVKIYTMHFIPNEYYYYYYNERFRF